jgi:hypothetical protein
MTTSFVGKMFLARNFAVLTFVSICLFYVFIPGMSSNKAATFQPMRRRIGVNHPQRVSHLNQRDDSNGTISQITSPDFVNIAFTSSNGNIYLEPQDTTSATTGFDTTTYFYGGDDGIIYSDYAGRLLHIYSGESAKNGISRIRLHDINKLPKTSVVV